MTAEPARDVLPRVLFAIGGLGRGGSERQLVELVCRAHGRWLDASVMTFAPTVAGHHAQRLHDAGIPHHLLEQRPRGNRLLRAAGMTPRVMAHMRAIQPALVYTWLEETALYLAPIARLQGVPLLVARRNVCGARAERYLPARVAIRAAERSAALVTANSDAAALDACRRGVRPDRVRLVRNGHAPVDPLPLPDDGVVRLGYVAQMRPEKGHLRLIETLRRVSTKAAWQVDLAGDGAMRAELVQVVAANSLSHRVCFLGEIDGVRSFWAHRHVGLLLSDSEGSPNALIEAALAGRPLVATATGGTPDVVAPAGGFVVELDDHDAAARAIESLIDDGSLRRRLGAGAHLQARQRFSLDASVEGHVQAIQEVLRTRAGRSG